MALEYYSVTGPVTIDLSEVQNKEELHTLLKSALDFPDYYGGNFDALHDCLTELGTQEAPLELTLAGYKHLKRALGPDYYTFRDVVEDSVSENPSLTVTWRRRA